ncbi:MAG: patatin-like phospholipase family protein [Muribaculaceae bacterium]|nr:patatin-like phospholipase family protein [Muribaculaceae bacterium]
MNHTSYLQKCLLLGASLTVIYSQAAETAMSEPVSEPKADTETIKADSVVEKVTQIPRIADIKETQYLPPNSTLPRVKGRESVGLVLSGGGAKGIAHVGVIKALEDNDIPIDYVTGTSMGAIVGSLYSCGWSPEQMLDLFTSSEFQDWATGTISQKHQYYYYEQRPSSKWIQVNMDLGKKFSITNQLIPTSLVSPLPMNIEFLNLYGPYTEQCGENFNKLFVPFRCVASDVYHKHKVVFGEGSLGESVRASMSFPLVFRPIEIGGMLMYDGGIYDNFPVNVMESNFNPDFIVGVSVSGADKKPIKGDIYSQLEDMIIQNNDYNLPADKGVKIQVPVLTFGVLQFDKAKTIYDIGYKTGMAMVDSIKSRIKAREPLAEVTARREKFASHTPELKFDKVKVEGLKGSSAHYLEYLFTNGNSSEFGMNRTINAYYRAVTDGSLSNLVPEAQFGKDGHNTLVLKATPRRPWSFALGGFLTTSTNSMIYLSGGYHTMGHNSLDVTLGIWVGQSYYAAMLNAKFALRTSVPSYLQFTGVLSKQKYFDHEELFFRTSRPMFMTEIENFGRMAYVWAIGQRMKGYVSLSGGYMSNAYYPKMSEGIVDVRDKILYRVGVIRMGVEGNTLNNQMYPSEGMRWLADLDLDYQWSSYLPGCKVNRLSDWRKKPSVSLHLEWQKYWSLNRHFSVGLAADGLATIMRLDQNYTNTLVHAQAFQPTPSMQNYFNLAFHSDNYLAAGVIPMWKPFRNMQLRGDFYAFAPFRQIKDNGPDRRASYGSWGPRNIKFLGEIAAIYNFPFASVSLYANYLSSPKNNWNFGLAFGLLFKAPRLMRNY